MPFLYFRAVGASVPRRTKLELPAETGRSSSLYCQVKLCFGELGKVEFFGIYIDGFKYSFYASGIVLSCSGS
jgi:hypothetical protein